MDLKQIAEREADAMLDDLRATAGTLVNRLATEDRTLVERTLARAAVVQAQGFITPGDVGVQEELHSLRNTISFATAKYQIEAGRALREFVDRTMDRVVKSIISAAFVLI